LIRILGNHGADISVNGRRERQGESYAPHGPFHQPQHRFDDGAL
jgi:hypothetical protein